MDREGRHGQLVIINAFEGLAQGVVRWPAIAVAMRSTGSPHFQRSGEWDALTSIC
jgi:hypothetical protein